MVNILRYEDFKLSESFPSVFSDPMYGSDIFRIRYRSNSDLSNKKGSDAIPKPVNDLLDKFQEGDIVTGKDVNDGKYKEGKIVFVKKDEEGENVEIFIEYDGQRISLAPATVSFVSNGDKGNRKPDNITAYDQFAIDLANSNTFIPTTYESTKNIKK